MPNVTVTLTQAQYDAMTTDMIDVSEWVNNAATSKAAVLTTDIIAKLIEHCNANSIALAVGEDAQIAQAFSLGVVSAVSNGGGDSA